MLLESGYTLIDIILNTSERLIIGSIIRSRLITNTTNLPGKFTNPFRVTLDN